MGRRRQHHGDLALASDQIPGLAQHNISQASSLSVLDLRRPFAIRHVNRTADAKAKASL
jgi:hypothetical protein